MSHILKQRGHQTLPGEILNSLLGSWILEIGMQGKSSEPFIS